MNTVHMQIDGKEVTAPEGTTILKAAGDAGIYIPTLCHDNRVEPYGGCRLCLVEITDGKRNSLVASCVYLVKDKLAVKTNTPKLKKIRRMIMDLLWPSIHDSELEKVLGPRRHRFEPEHTDCCLCGLCVRYCSEIKKKNAIYFKGRGTKRQLAIIPELASECGSCRECFTLCRGGRVIDVCYGALA